MKAFFNFHIMSNYIKQINICMQRYDIFWNYNTFFSVFLLSGENSRLLIDFLHQSL